ncbi:MAG: PQQ-binding-like beta-propeller repeat protein [Thermomicrobiales bacterium]
MNRMVGAPLAILLALSGLLAPSPARATAQVDGNTYTSPNLGYSLTWDDSWFLLDGPNTEQGFEEFTLANGASIVIFFAEEDGIGNAQVIVSSILLGINTDPDLTNVQPLTDENGDNIRGGDASRAFGGITFTDESDGQTSEGVAYVEARALVPGQSTLSLLHIVPQQVYQQEAPLVQDLLNGLTITGQASPDPDDDTPEADEEETPAPEEVETAEPTAAPEVAEAPQAFASANWRVTVVAAQQDEAIREVGLEARDDNEWIVVVADITNWSVEADELAPRDIELRFPEGNPNQVALRSTVTVANELEIGPADVEQAVAFQPDETQRWALVFLVDADQVEAALALRLAMSIEPVIESNVDLFDLPPLTDPPELIEASVDVVRDGGTLDATTEADGDEVRVELLGVDAPAGDDCFADESREELEALAGATIFLEYPDGGDASDGPAYVWVERANSSRILINRQLIAGGSAAYDPADSGLFASWLGDAQASAENRAIGLWEACAGLEEEEPTAEAEATEDVTPDLPTVEATEDPTEEATATPTEEATEELTAEPTEEAAATSTPTGREQGRQQDVEDDSEDVVIADGVMFRGDAAHTGAQPGPGLGEPATFPWEFRIGFPVISSPAVVDGVVYIGSLNSEVYALDAFSGPPRWTFLTEGEVISSPAVADGLVYVGSNDGNLYAINADTGTERWRFTADNAIQSSPAVVGGVVYVASDDTFLYAVDAATGEERWSLRIGPAFSSPAVIDGVVYIGAAQTLFAIDAQSGEEIWRFQTGTFLSSSPAVSNGMVYIGNDGGSVIAVDATSGEETWRFQAEGPVLSSPAVADGTVFIGSDDRFVYALDAESGDERWRFETGDAVSSSPAVADGVVYVGSFDTFLYGLDAETGVELTRTQLGPILSSPAVVDGIVYVATADGVVHARQPFDVLGIPGFGGPPAGTPVPER